jgi:hypothetical protein
MAKSQTKSRTASQLKTSMIISIIVAVLCFLGAAFYTIGNWDFMILGKTVNLNEVIADGGSPQKGDHVKLKVYFVLGNFAETKHTINGFIPAGKEQHYGIMMEDGSVIAVTLKSSSDIDKFEDIYNKNWNLLEAEDYSFLNNYIEITGTVKTMNSQIEGFYKTALSGADITAADTNIYYLSIDATDTRFSYFLVDIFLLAVMALCIFLFFVNKKKRKELSELQAIAKSNAADPSLNPFLNQNAGEAATTNPYEAVQANYPHPTEQGGYADPNAQQYNGYADPNAQYNGYNDPNAQGGYADPNAQYNGYNDPNTQGGYSDPYTQAGYNDSTNYNPNDPNGGAGQ